MTKCQDCFNYQEALCALTQRGVVGTLIGCKFFVSSQVDVLIPPVGRVSCKLIAVADDKSRFGGKGQYRFVLEWEGKNFSVWVSESARGVSLALAAGWLIKQPDGKITLPPLGSTLWVMSVDFGKYTPTR